LASGARHHSVQGRKAEPGADADWKEGTLLVPPLQWYHQHFNSGKRRRVREAGGWNNDLYPFTTTLVSDPGRHGNRLSMRPAGPADFRGEIGCHGGQFKMPESGSRKDRKIDRRGDIESSALGNVVNALTALATSTVGGGCAVRGPRAEQARPLGVCYGPIAAVRERTPKTVRKRRCRRPSAPFRTASSTGLARWRIDYPIVSVKKNKCEYLDCFMREMIRARSADETFPVLVLLALLPACAAAAYPEKPIP